MNDISRRLRSVAAVFASAILISAPLHAQEISPAQGAAVDSSVVTPAAPLQAGPTVAAAAVAVHANAPAPMPAAPMAGTHSQGQPIAMMVVGGAAIVAGAIVGGGGGYAISVGGAVIGLIGLYQYLQ